jgi:predicted Zn-dependent peptidase
MNQIERLRNEIPSQQDVDDAIAYYVESFPKVFQSKMAMLGTYVSDEYTGRDPQFWQTYVENIKKVTPDDVLRVAKEYLHPDRLVILAVGDAETILAGGHDKAPALRLDSFGQVTRLPLRDPDTLER